jgi:hypothetical protein
MAKPNRLRPSRRGVWSRVWPGRWGGVGSFSKGLLDGYHRIPDLAVDEQVGIRQTL